MPEQVSSLVVRTIPAPKVRDFNPSTPRPRRYSFGRETPGADPAYRVTSLGATLARLHGDGATFDAALAVAIEVQRGAEVEAGAASVIVWRDAVAVAVLAPGGAEAVVLDPDVEVLRFDGRP